MLTIQDQRGRGGGQVSAVPSTIPFNSTCRPKKTTPQLMPVSSALLTVCQNNEENGDATLDIIGFR